MHRKSLEAAEHIRKHDEKFSDDNSNGEVFSQSPVDSLLVSSAPASPNPAPLIKQQPPPNAYEMPPTTKKLNDSSKKKKDLKSESVANLRAKAKEHSAKLMESAAKRDLENETTKLGVKLIKKVHNQEESPTQHNNSNCKNESDHTCEHA